MDRDEALKLLQGGRPGIAEWNRRRRTGEKMPDFSEADLREADLGGADLTSAVFEREPPTEGHLAAPAPRAEWEPPEPRSIPSLKISSYYPKEVLPRVWHPFYAYLFRKSAAALVEADASQVLGKWFNDYRPTEEVARRPIAVGTAITATPSVDAFQFNPRSLTIEMQEDWCPACGRSSSGPELRRSAVEWR